MAKNLICDLRNIFQSSVVAVLPKNLIRKCVNFNSTTQQLSVAGLTYNLNNKNVYVVGAGKAVQSMASEIENIFSSKIKQGIISIPFGSFTIRSNGTRILYYEGAKNNLPDCYAEDTAKKIKDIATKLNDKDFLFVLLSGGGSALLPLPKAPIILEEKTKLIKKLANSGADIKELNTVRKRLSEIKGGQLAITAQPSQVVTLVLSDIVGDPLDLIASGPTSENKDNPLDAIGIINKYNLMDDLSNSIKTVLNESKESIKFPNKNVENIIIGSNKLSIEAAFLEAKKLGYFPLILSNIVTGDVIQIANEYEKLVKMFCNYKMGHLNIDELKNNMLSLNIPGLKSYISEIVEEAHSIKNEDLCLVLGGETTVEVKGIGKGGRNQQLALEFSKTINNSINEFKNYEIYLLSAGTDGIDGPTDAAGAIGYKNLISDCTRHGINVDTYLDNNDTYNFYKSFRNGELHVVTGHTNTNVMDIHLIIIKNVQIK